MTGWVQEDAEDGRLRLEGSRRPTGRDHSGLLRVQILGHEIQVGLLRYARVRPRRRPVVEVTLEAEAGSPTATASIFIGASRIEGGLL